MLRDLGWSHTGQKQHQHQALPRSLLLSLTQEHPGCLAEAQPLALSLELESWGV